MSVWPSLAVGAAALAALFILFALFMRLTLTSIADDVSELFDPESWAAKPLDPTVLGAKQEPLQRRKTRV